MCLDSFRFVNILLSPHRYQRLLPHRFAANSSLSLSILRHLESAAAVGHGWDWFGDAWSSNLMFRLPGNAGTCWCFCSTLLLWQHHWNLQWSILWSACLPDLLPPTLNYQIQLFWVLGKHPRNWAWLAMIWSCLEVKFDIWMSGECWYVAAFLTRTLESGSHDSSTCAFPKPSLVPWLLLPPTLTVPTPMYPWKIINFLFAFQVGIYQVPPSFKRPWNSSRNLFLMLKVCLFFIWVCGQLIYCSGCQIFQIQATVSSTNIKERRSPLHGRAGGGLLGLEQHLDAQPVNWRRQKRWIGLRQVCSFHKSLLLPLRIIYLALSYNNASIYLGKKHQHAHENTSWT